MSEVEEQTVWKSKSGMKVNVIKTKENIIEFWDIKTGAIYQLSLDSFLSKYVPTP